MRYYTRVGMGSVLVQCEKELGRQRRSRVEERVVGQNDDMRVGQRRENAVELLRVSESRCGVAI